MAEPYFSSRRAMRWAPLWAAIALLAACGGGSPGDAPRQPAADGEVVPLSANPSSIAIRYAVADTYQGPTSHPAHQLNVVDRLSGDVVWHATLALSHGDYTWIVSDGYQRDTGTQSTRYIGPQLLYFVQEGKVFQMDISGSVTPTPQRISSLDNACGLNPEIFPVQHDGRHDWLLVRTSGADGDCDQPAGNGQALVSSGMPATTAAIALPSGQAVVLNRLPDDQNQSTGMMTLDASLRRIVIKSNDLTQTLYTFPGDVAPDQAVRVLAPLPGQGAQWLVQVGAQLRVLDRGGATPTLGPVLASLSDPSAPVFCQWDAQGLYLANGRQVLSVSARGVVSTLSTLPSEGGKAIGLWLSATSVLALQDEDSNHAQAQTGRVLWSIRRGTASRQALVQGQPYDETTVVSVENGLVYYSQWSDDLTADLHKVRDNGSGQALVASNAHQITAIVHPVITPGSVSVQGLVWCESVPERFDCSDGKVVAYDTSTATKTTLGTLPGNGANYTDARTIQQGWTGAQNLLFVPRWYQIGDGSSGYEIQTSLWLFSAGTANSLREVPLAP